MTIRKFVREELEAEPHRVLFKDLYPWDAIEDTPFGASLAVVQPGGRTMQHGHDPAETFIICRGRGTMTIDGEVTPVTAGDVVYLRPRCLHDLRNDSDAEDLVFVSVFWDAQDRGRTEGDGAPRLIAPSPPTPNGPLHLGHLAGPYLAADAMRRYHRARGIPAVFVCLLDEHQSYVLDRARAEGRAPGELAGHFGERIAATLARFSAAPDACVSPVRDEAYRAAIRARFARLAEGGKLEEREVEVLCCERCELALYDSFVAGACPHCGAASYGFLCEACGAPNDPARLRDPVCDRCGEAPARRRARRLFLPIEPYAERLADYHARLRLPPKLRRLAAQWLAAPAPVPASQDSPWGLPVELAGFEGQVISPWLEVALAGGHLVERFAPGGRVHHLFGYDNAFLYLIHDPAASLALDPGAELPAVLAANEFLMLDDAKMSTSGGHALDADQVLAQLPADLLRLYLARIRPEEVRTSASLPSAQVYLTLVAQHWQGWLARLGACLAAEAGAAAPAPANPSLQPWPLEQAAFLAELKQLAGRARQAYEDGSLKEAAAVLHELAERAASFGATQVHLAGVPSLAGQRATGLALELAAARTFAAIAAPLMPAFAERLWRCLGHDGPIAWSGDVEPVPPGQRIDAAELAARRFFPERIELGA